VGRFAPSPSGPLHAGSLVAAMASYLDARAHQGRWLVRIEDIDGARSVPGMAQEILACLAAHGIRSDGPVLWQSQRLEHYRQALQRLAPWTYPCACSRREIADSHSGTGADGAVIYPGTCRAGLAPGKHVRAWRLRVPDAGDAGECISFVDRWQGEVRQHLATEVGDFVLQRADGFFAYQLAVVVDDDMQGVSDVVRGVDLLDSSARQIHLQRLLGLPTPRYLHVPLLRNSDGEKLSKQTGAQALDPAQPLPALLAAAQFLGLPLRSAVSVADFWDQAIPAWAARWVGGY